MTVPTILLLGDSLTGGYATELGRLLVAAGVQVRLLLAFRNGANISEVAAELTRKETGYLARFGVPTIAVVCVGTNDLAGQTGANVPDLLSQWQGLIASLTARGARVVACTIPPTSLPGSPGVVPFNAGVRAWVSGHAARVRLADVGAVVPVAELGADGVHLSPAGVARMARTIGHVISSRVPSSSSPTKSKNPIAKAADEVKRRRTLAGVLIVAAGAALYFYR